MEAAILTATPSPMPMQDTQPASPTQSSEATGSFSTLLAAAVNGGDETEQGTPSQPTSPEEGETTVAAELAALAFQQMPAMVEAPQNPQAGVALPLAPTTETLPGQNTSPLVSNPGDNETIPVSAIPSLFSKDESDLPSSSVAPTLPGVPGPSSSADDNGTFNQHDNGILNRQIQAILTADSKISANLHPSAQNTSTEALNTLSSTIIPTEGQNDGIITAVTREALSQGAAEGKGATEKLDGGRHSLNEQFISAKLESASEKKDSGNHQQGNGQQNQQQENSTAPVVNSSTTTNLNSTELGSHFLLNTPSLTPGTHPGASTSASASTTPTQFIPAEEVINHLVERFSINPRLQTSKISLSLTPAELGPVKVDIMVQGDSIKAHIVAGSQQIQDTIEKQMPRLRSVLEQQGFTVDDFRVSLDSDASDSNSFFEQQFASRNWEQKQNSTQPGSQSQELSFNLSLHAAETGLTPSASGINLNI